MSTAATCASTVDGDRLRQRLLPRRRRRRPGARRRRSQTGPSRASADAPDGTALLREVTRAFRTSRTVVFDEPLSSSATGGIDTRFTLVAPNRLSYHTKGGGPAIVIGGRRWDQSAAGKPWLASPQTPLDVPQPYWTTVSNVHEVSPGLLTFLDRSVPAWFRMRVANGCRRVSHMTAAAHFMTERYVGFDDPVDVSPPSR